MCHFYTQTACDTFPLINPCSCWILFVVSVLFPILEASQQIYFLRGVCQVSDFRSFPTNIFLTWCLSSVRFQKVPNKYISYGVSVKCQISEASQQIYFLRGVWPVSDFRSFPTNIFLTGCLTSVRFQKFPNKYISYGVSDQCQISEASQQIYFLRGVCPVSDFRSFPTNIFLTVCLSSVRFQKLPNKYISYRVSVQCQISEASQQIYFLWGDIFSLTPNPQHGGPGYPFLPGSPPVTRLARDAIPATSLPPV